MTRLDDNDWSDLDDIDVWTVDRLLDGRVPISDVPLGYEEVSSLLNVVRAGVAPAESGWGSSTVPAMARILTAPPPRRRRRVRPSFVAAQAGRASHAAAAVLVFAALGAGTAAAATGSLPDPVQSAVHSAAVDLGVPSLAPPAAESFESRGSESTIPPPVSPYRGVSNHPLGESRVPSSSARQHTGKSSGTPIGTPSTAANGSPSNADANPSGSSQPASISPAGTSSNTVNTPSSATPTTVSSPAASSSVTTSPTTAPAATSSHGNGNGNRPANPGNSPNQPH